MTTWRSDRHLFDEVCRCHFSPSGTAGKTVRNSLKGIWRCKRKGQLLLTLGIDLASQPKKTAGCLIAWDDHGANVSLLELGLADDDILALADRADVVAIDAPFGWPQPFVEFVSGAPAAREAAGWDAAARDALCFRRTDFHVRGLLGRWPLSVSSDRIAVTAMRCAGLLGRLNVADRSGTGRVVEVYPVVALRMWGFPYKGYKAKEAVSDGREGNLVGLLKTVMVACPWLRLSDEAFALCSQNDHAFDALVASLVGRAAALGLTIPPSNEDAALAAAEGWIAAPRTDTLDHLTATSRQGPGPIRP